MFLLKTVKIVILFHSGLYAIVLGICPGEDTAAGGGRVTYMVGQEVRLGYLHGGAGGEAGLLTWWGRR